MSEELRLKLADRADNLPRCPTPRFRFFKASPKIIRVAVMQCIRCPLSRRNVESLLHERGIDICHETVRFSQRN